MKQLLLVLTLLTFTILSYSQTNCDIKEHFGDFIKIKKVKNRTGNSEYLIKRVVKVDGKECFADLVNIGLENNGKYGYISYLLTNFSSDSNYQYLLTISDSVALQTEYIKSLKEDSLFNSVISDLVSKTIYKSKPKDTISLDKLLNIAVKYFYIWFINDEGSYVGKVCGGLNSIKKTEKVRQPQIEAFCFISIYMNYEGKKYNMHEEFIKALKELNKVQLGIDLEERLLRAQGAMFLLMKNNKNLQNMLISEYNKNKNNLPFVLIK